MSFIPFLRLFAGCVLISLSGLAFATTDDDAKAVADLDTKYQAAVKINDAETMASILHDDFTLVVGNGAAFSKADLLKSARDKSAIYERQDEELGTQKVRVTGDTAVVTAKLWLKGVQGDKPFDRKLWFTDTYVRTPTGWRYFFGQASLSLPAAKRIVLIGATAKSAPAFFLAAFAKGYEVIGIARRPEAVEVKDKRLTVVKGDVYDEKSIEAALNGDEVVVSYLSCCKASDTPHGETARDVDLLSRGIYNITQAMKAKGNKRLIAVSSTGVEHIYLDKPSEDAPTVDKMMWNGRYKFDDQRRMEAIIVASGLDYTIVRPSRVTGDVASGAPLNIAVNKITYDPYNHKLSRPDLAAFILDQMDSRQYVGAVVGVYN